MTSTTRQLKVARLVHKEMSDIFQRDKKGFLNGAFVTIADVRISADLGVAKIYVSMMLARDKKAILDSLNRHKKEIRKALGDRIGRQLRIVPELIFYIDEVEENAFRIEALINSLDIPPEPKPGDEQPGVS